MRAKKAFFLAIFILLFLLVAGFAYFFVGSAPQQKNIAWGVDFSQAQATSLGLDWKAAYTALLTDLGAKYLKIGVDWDLVESSKGIFNFTDIDWQIGQAKEAGAEVILVMGLKTPRWPECHIPGWANKLSEKKDQQNEIVAMIQQIVGRYKNVKTVWAWQVENEPFFLFGICPWHDDAFVKREVALVHSLDSGRPVIISDTGEYSFWAKAASIGDIVGTTMYRATWFAPLRRYITYPLPAVFYWRKAQLIQWFFYKPVIDIELQAEPWTPGKSILDTPLEEQMKTMNLEQFKKNIEFAKASGLSKHYFWGAEWWYWLKEKQNNPLIWNEAKHLF